MKRVVITGSGGQLAYSLIFRIAAGDLFGEKEPISLHLRDIKEMEKVLEGVKMELEDCAFPLLEEIRIGHDPHEMFEGVDCAFLVGSKPRGPGMERKDLLLDNGKIFVEEGKALNRAHKDAKVLVVGNPCNTNCLIALHHAKELSPKNFHAMMRLDQNRAQSLLAKKAGVRVSDISCMTIWGNHSSTQVPDFTNAKIKGKKASECIERTHLESEFVQAVQKRGSAIIAARGKSSAGSAAQAALDAMHALYIPTSQNSWFSSAIYTHGNPYGIAADLVFGFPCQVQSSGECTIVEKLPWDSYMEEKIALTQKELLDERDIIKGLLS